MCQQVEDLQNWATVMKKLIHILRDVGQKLPNYKHTQLQLENEDDLAITIKVLAFLGKLMKAGRDKRFFLSFQVHPIL